MPHDGNGAPRPAETGFSFEYKFKADFRYVRRSVQTTCDAMHEFGLVPDDIGAVEIVLAEILNNIVEHGYEEGTDEQIELFVKSRGASLMFDIRDRGRPMPKGRLPVGNHPMSEFNQFDAMPEGGYGWFLIRELVRDIVYDRKDGQNMLMIRMKLTEPDAD